MSKYEGLYTFDTDSHMYIPVGQVDDDYFNVREEEPKQPLIEDEKIRKAVRAWAEACGAKRIKYSKSPNQYYDADIGTGFSIKFLVKPVEVCLEDDKCYTIAELCGEEEE